MLSAPTQETHDKRHGSKHSAERIKENSERRIGADPIPDRIDLYLNKDQMEALNTMEYFGWELSFIRRSDLSNIIPVIKHLENNEYAVLDDDGDIIRNPDIGIRH